MADHPHNSSHSQEIGNINKVPSYTVGDKAVKPSANFEDPNARPQSGPTPAPSISSK